MREPVEDSLAFRWDLVTPDHLGSLLAGTATPNLWFLDELVACAGKVLARSGNGDLIFVGRSLDSMFDLLGGALADADDNRRLLRLPLSFARDWARRPGSYRRRPLTPGEIAQSRRFLARIGITPHALARRDRPVTFVDVVHLGATFDDLFDLLHTWFRQEPGAWQVARRKLRFVGVTSRKKTSPNTYRWHQHADWPTRLSTCAVINVSLHPAVWSYFGDHQVKLTRALRPEQWLATTDRPAPDDRTRQALAEAAAIVAYGRSTAGRQALARAMRGEAALAEPWLRTLVTRLTSG